MTLRSQHSCSFPATGRSRRWPAKTLSVVAAGLFSLLLLGPIGCRSTDVQPADQSLHTLARDPRLPVRAIRRLFGVQEWRWWKNLRYDRIVILRGQVEDDGRLSALHVTTAYPDDSRNAMALELSRQLRVSAVRIGSRTRPSGEVYAVFYESGGGPRYALVFGVALDPVAPSTMSITNRQVLIHAY